MTATVVPMWSTMSVLFWISAFLTPGSAAGYSLVVAVRYPVSNLNPGDAMFLRGDSLGLSWTTGQKMEYTAENTWNLTVPFDATQANNVVQMKVMVNDQTWMIGANVMAQLPQGSAYVEIFPFFFLNKGVYNYHRDIYSPQLQNYRDLVVYTPASYIENTLKTMTDVLVMHDGQNLFNASTAFGGIAWFCQDTVDQLIFQGSMRDIIIVGVDNTNDRINEYTYSYDPTVPGGGKGNIYLDFLEETVVPFVKNAYRMETGQQNLGMLGSSLGGLISCYAGWTRNSVWGTVGCMSSSFWWNNEDFNGTVMTKYPAPPSLDVYVDSGDSGPGNDDETQTITVRNHMESLGFDLGQDLWYYLDKGGMHNERYWGQRFWVPMTDLYPPKNTPTHPLV